MDKLKKLNGSMIAAIVLSVLLIMSLTAGATLAWFSSRDAGVRTLTMGEAVVVTISDQNAGQTYRQGDGQLSMILPVDEASNGLLPGMSITPNLKVQLQGSNTNALLRARFITTVEYPHNYEDAAYTDRAKYPNKTDYNATTGGAVLDETAFPNDHIYSGVMYYDYYDYQGRLIEYMEWDGTGAAPTEGVPAGSGTLTSDGKYALDKNGARIQTGVIDEPADKHSVSIQLTRVKVRDEIHKAVGLDTGSTVIAGIAVQNTEIKAANAAAYELRQRGADLTDAVNKVLSGERGYGIDPKTGELVMNEDIGIRYSRRVADGWAYRQADRAWYYLGSRTNGFVLTNQSDVSEAVDTSKPVAKDITAYTAQANNAGTSTVYVPTYTTLAGDGATLDRSRNYLGSPDGGAGVLTGTGVVTPKDNEESVMKQSTIASVDLTAGGDGGETGANVSIDFLTKKFALPTFINNDYAKARVTFTFTVEAIQDYLVDPLQEAYGNPERIPNNLVNAILVFNHAFPATRTAGEADLAATGVYTNVTPGDQNLKFSAAGALDATGTAITPANKGFGTKTNDDGDTIADYTIKNTTYVAGSSAAGSKTTSPASSLGVQTDGTEKITITASGGGSD